MHAQTTSFRINFISRRVLLAFAFAALTTLLGAGCIPLGNRRGPEQVVAQRTQPDGGVTEQIVAAPTEHHWCLFFTPEGPELNYVLSETWRFYLAGADGRREPIHFLRKRGGTGNPWELIAPIPQTNLWIAVLYTGSLRRVEHGHYDYRVICFSPKRIISDHTLDYHGRFLFNPGNGVLTNGGRTYDPLAGTNRPSASMGIRAR